ncbi:MAG: hypothetical protein PSX36_01380 [bacterium]|nr:hypothetical protein [bacterium]
MKKKLLLVTSVLIVLAVSMACEKKGNPDAITPDYSATGNPNPNNQTVTGTSSYTNPATQNSSLLVGSLGWSNLTCASTNSTTLKGNNGVTDVTLAFSSAAKTGTYAIASQVSIGSCVMTILNAPNQPAGIVWQGYSGSVSVTTSTAGINAIFANVVCTQKTFNFPTVAASGTLSCGN